MIKFSKIHLVTLFVILILTQCQKKKKANEEEEIDLDQKDIKIDISAFESLPGISISSIDEMDKITSESDLTFLVFYYSKKSKNSYVSSLFLRNIYQKLEFLAGFINIDCDVNPSIDRCKEEIGNGDGDSYPRLKLLIPPQFKINPYTKKEEKYTQQDYSKNSLSENDIYTFITNNIKGKGQKLNWESHKQILSHPNFNKVLLFTDKKQSGLIFKGLSSYFYDRILFCEIQNSEAELVSKYKIKKYPTLIVVETLDEDLESPRDQEEVHEYTGNLKAKDISEFILKYALKEKMYMVKKGHSSDEYSKEKIFQTLFKTYEGEKISSALEKLKQKKVILYITKGSQIDENTEGIIEFAAKTTGFYSFIRLDCEKEVNAVFCGNIKLSKYPAILLLNEEGLQLSTRIEKGIVINGSKYKDIVNEISSEYTFNVIGVTNETFNSITYKDLQENKRPVIYFFDDKQNEIDIVVNLLSIEDDLKDLFVFYGFSNSDPKILNQLGLKGVPNLVILGKDELDSDNAKIFPLNQEIIYKRLRGIIDQMISQTSSTQQKVKREKKELIFVENYSKLKEECLNKRRACFISLLDMRENKESKERFESNLATLNSLVFDNYERPFSYFYLNATCHTDVLLEFGISVDTLPTALIYVPLKEVYISLISTFDKESIDGFLDRAMQGKVSMQSATKSRFEFKEKNCSLIQEEVIVEQEDDEIMKEIMEERRKKELEDGKKKEEEKSKKKGKKKKKNKKEDL